MHCLTLVVLYDRPEDTASAVRRALAPFKDERETGDDNEAPGIAWDYYEHGGRWAGIVTGNEGTGRTVCKALRREGCTPAYLVIDDGKSDPTCIDVQGCSRSDRAEIMLKLEGYHAKGWVAVVDAHQ